jgi:acetyl esterase/lipase
MRAHNDGLAEQPASAESIPPALADWLSSLNTLITEMKRRDGYARTPTVVREGLAVLTARFVTQRPEVGRVIDDLVPGPGLAVPIRVYHPEPDSDLPLIVFVHGGGHVAGGVSVYDAITRKLALATRHVVISVDYRLAPECPYPAGLADVITVVKGMQRVLADRGIRFQPRVSLVGDSAGGALCATAAHMLRYEPTVEVHAQVLIYPSLDYTLSLPSTAQFAKGYLLERDRVAWYFDQYFQHAENRHDVSPLFMPCADDLPRTLVLTAQCCLLRDEGEAYAGRLREAGVDVEYVECEGMIHAFLNLEDLVPEQCAELYRRVAGFLWQ